MHNVFVSDKFWLAADAFYETPGAATLRRIKGGKFAVFNPCQVQGEDQPGYIPLDKGNKNV